MTIGIYAIYFENIDKIYIGQSHNVSQRITAHKKDLRLGTSTTKIREAYSLDQNVSFHILHECKLEELDALEISYIAEFDSVNNGLNISAGGIGGSYGYYSAKCRYTKEQLEYAFDLLCDPELLVDSIVKMSGVSRDTISSISAKKRHIWLHEAYPEKSELVLKNKRNRLSNAQQNRFGTNVELKSPEGIVYTCTNAAQFARDHNLNTGHLGAVIRKQETQHKGWTLYEKGAS